MVLGGGGIALPSLLNLCLVKTEPKHNLKRYFMQLKVAS